MDSVTPPPRRTSTPSDRAPSAALRPSRGRAGRGAFLCLIAPFAFLLIGAFAWRGAHRTAAPGHLPTHLHAPSLSSDELSALNAARLKADQSEAYQAAQNEVRNFLLHPGARISARFPGRLTGRSVSIEKRAPTRFRVRGIVEWQPENGANQAVQTRRFEADLRHGPADDKWHLIDTEFLDAAAK